MKTAMQELLEWHRKSMRSYSETNKMIEVLLEKEKEQIIEAYEDGKQNGMDSITNIHMYIIGEMYYNQTYNQNK